MANHLTLVHSSEAVPTEEWVVAQGSHIFSRHSSKAEANDAARAINNGYDDHGHWCNVRRAEEPWWAASRTHCGESGGANWAVMGVDAPDMHGNTSQGVLHWHRDQFAAQAEARDINANGGQAYITPVDDITYDGGIVEIRGRDKVLRSIV